MSAFLTGLASIADQYGQAKNSAEADKQARAEKLRSMDVQGAYLQLAKQADERNAESHKQAIAKGDLLQISPGRWWSVSQNKLVIGPKQSDPVDIIKQYIGWAPESERAELALIGKTEMEADPGNPQKAISAVLQRHKELKAEADKREDQAKAEENRRADNKTREDERRQDRKDSRNELETFQKQMIDMRLAEKQKYMTPQERQTYDAVKQVEPAVQRTIDYLEQTKDSNGQPLKDENGYVFGDRSALMQHLRARGYKFGTKQEDVSQNLIKNAALVQVLGARPWMTMGRGKFIYETISQHLPSPTDTPANMYDKLTWLRDNVLSDAKNSLAGYVSPGANVPLIPGEEVEH